MKIQVLMENTARDERLAAGHGLSVYVETANHKILVDAGPDARISSNAMAMGIDLAAIDTVVLSHGHYDHSGGLTEFMRINKKAVIYAAAGYEKPHYDKNGAYIGVEPTVIDNPRIQIVENNHKIDDELAIFNFNFKEPAEPIDDCGMTEGELGEFKIVKLLPERFNHEQYLMVKDGDSKVIFTGCSHKGIINIASWVNKYHPTAIMGGFHLMGVPKENYDRLDHVAAELKKFDIKFYTGHCTGADQYTYLKELMGDQLSYASGGDVFEI